MNKLTEEEFTDRMGALARAERIFPDVLNVTERFKLYQEVFAEREREIFLSTQYQGNRPRTAMDKFDRPKCPDCGEDMMFRSVAKNPANILTQLVCTKCDLVLGDEHDLKWWQENLKVKEDGNSGIS